MSSVLLISYDLINPGQNYEQLMKLIKNYGSWARLGGSAYLISTEQTPVQVRDSLKSVLDENDKLFVGVSPRPSAWVGLPDDVSNWIHANQT
jgi:hypothetical protein